MLHDLRRTGRMGAATLRSAALTRLNLVAEPCGVGHGVRELSLGESRGDVLRTVPVKGLELEGEGTLRPSAVAWVAQPGSELGFGRQVVRGHACEDLQPAPVGIVHQEEGHSSAGSA